MSTRIEEVLFSDPENPTCDSAANTQSGKHTTIVIPAYNEEEGLPVVLGELYGVIDGGYEILVVDDGSTDATERRACEFPCRVVRHALNGGKGAAMHTGIALATGENILFIDADGTYPAEHIPEMIRLLSSGYRYVRCTRREGRVRIPLINRIGNFFLDTGIAVFSGMRSTDFLTGLYGLKKQDLQAMALVSKGFDIEAEIAVKAGAMGLKPAEIPSVYRERIGQVKLQSLPDGFRIGLRVIKTGVTFNPLLALFPPGALLFLVGLVGLLVTFLSAPLLAGQTWPTYTLSLTALLLGGQLSLAGLVLNWHAFTYGIRRRLPAWVLGFSGWCASRLFLAVSVVVSILGFVLVFLRNASENPRSVQLGFFLLSLGSMAAFSSLVLSIALRLSEKAPEAVAYQEVQGP